MSDLADDGLSWAGDPSVCPACHRPLEDGAAHPHGGTPPEVHVGARLGPYYVQQVVGEGGMGRVFRAVHENLGRPVAIKIIHREIADLETVQGFLREARAMNRVRHPHVIEVIDIIVTPIGEGDSYYVMEWLEGKNVYARMRECGGRIAALEAVRIAIDAAHALETVHKAGLVHCDLKPENLYLLTRDGRHDYVKVIDFGVARDRTDVLADLEACVSGTPAYMAPEQARGYIDERCDIYALGVILYEMVVGQLPFQLDEQGVPLTRHVRDRDAMPLPRRAAPRGVKIPRELERIILTAMSPAPTRRYPNMAALLVDLEALYAQLQTSLWRTVWRAVDGRLLLRYVVWGLLLTGLWMRRDWMAAWLSGPSAPYAAQPDEPRPELEVQVYSRPREALVIYKGHVLGVTPCVVRLPEGPAEIELRHAGYRQQVVPLQVRVGAAVNIRLSR